jgi:hypothetical protein
MSWLKSFRTKAAIIYGVTIALVNLGTACSWSNCAFQMSKIASKLQSCEEICVKKLVQTDFVHNVVSGGTRSTTLGVDTPTQPQQPYMYVMFMYI